MYKDGSLHFNYISTACCGGVCTKTYTNLHITYLGIVTCFSNSILRSDDSGRGHEVEKRLNATFFAAYPPLPQLFYSI